MTTRRVFGMTLCGLIALAATPFLATAGGKAELSKEEAAEGFKLLFNGVDFEGWRGFRKEGMPEEGWKIDGGSIQKIAGGGGGDIITLDQYSDFDLRFEWKVAPGANSGVFYRSTEEGRRTYDTAAEYQILDDDKHGDGKNPLTSAASNYALYPAKDKKLKPVGEFNTGRVLAEGGHLRHYLNGDLVVDCWIGSEDWKEHIENSKFADNEMFCKPTKGHVALQDHGDDVWYRNIRIKDLSK